eukprot:scaffold84473_cov51-Attheya_sp.AAC.2
MNNRIFADPTDKYCVVKLFDAYREICHPDQVEHRSFGSQKPYARGSVATQIQTSITLGKHPREEIIEEVEEKKLRSW